MIVDEQYFEETLQFFYDNQWIFKHPVTKILVNNCLDEFPESWLIALNPLSYRQLNNFVTAKLIDDKWPESLRNFALECKRLNRLTIAIELSNDIELPKVFSQGLSLKKQHEVFYFTRLIHEKCVETGIRTIVDLGAGLVS